MTPHLVEAFYQRIWNDGDLEATAELLTEEFRAHGSITGDAQGRTAFLEYVRWLRGALTDYHCEIQDCVSEGDRAFVRVCFSGLHSGNFLGFPPTGMRLEWRGTALFRLEGDAIAEAWVLADQWGLHRMLHRNQAGANQAGANQAGANQAGANQAEQTGRSI